MEKLENIRLYKSQKKMGKFELRIQLTGGGSAVSFDDQMSASDVLLQLSKLRYLLEKGLLRRKGI